jgi:DNA mismatch repair protein MutS2
MDIEKELSLFIEENGLFPFNESKSPFKGENDNIYKTRDGKIVHNRVIFRISNNFCFPDTSNLLNWFSFTSDINEIKKRQEFFKSVPKEIENNFLKNLKKPKPCWRPKYGIIAVTDNENTFSGLKGLNIPVKFLLNEDDVRELENYDIVQAVDVEQFGAYLEQLTQSVFLNDIDDVYLEKYLEILSGWEDNFKILEKIDNEELKKIIYELNPLLELIRFGEKEKITRSLVEEELEKINREISNIFKNLNISGEILFEMLSQNRLPAELEKIINIEIKKSKVPENLLNASVPVKIDEEELENFLKMQEAGENTNFAEKVKKNSNLLKKVPEKLNRISQLILIYDFFSGIFKFIKNCGFFTEFSNELKIENVKNIFLENPQAINFNLNDRERCSILTGANSGGKTTLIEHIIQIISLSNIGLPLNGRAVLPIFSEVYYFAKTKGSTSKGAFETLLTQMSKIKPGKQTLILADEIEAVTEPGVAGKIIAATCRYFIEKNCFLVIATHLGQEIAGVLPLGARIDGIEAKGLDSNNELIVDHNPVLGKLANSTPELIVEKMANSQTHDYFNYLNDYLKNNK